MQQNDQIPQFVPCFREDGSFDLHRFILAPQVIGGLLSIIASLTASFLVSNVFHLKSDIASMLILMFCAFTCFSGADSIIKYLNMSRELVDKK